MRALPLVLALLTIAPTVEALGLLAEVSPEGDADILVTSVRPARAPAPVPAAERVLASTPARGAADPAPLAALQEVPFDSVIEELAPLLPEAPVEHREARSRPGPATKSARLDAAAAAAREVSPLAPARLSLAPPASALPLGPEAAPFAIEPRAVPAPAHAPRDARPSATDPPAPVASAASPHLGAAAGALGLALLVIGPILYHRMRGAHAVAQQETRARMLAILRDEPGIGPSALARAIGADPTTAVYHVRRLAKEGLVVARAGRHGTVYFAAGAAVPPNDIARIEAQRGAAPLLDAIRAEPGASKSELATRLAMARVTVSAQLARLERAGLVRCERSGRRVRAFATAP